MKSDRLGLKSLVPTQTKVTETHS